MLGPELSIVFTASLLTIGVVAIRWGSPHERVVALSYASAYAFTMLALMTNWFRFAPPGAFTLATDVGLFAALTIVAVRTDRLWVIASASLQLLLLFGYFTKWIFPSMNLREHWVLLTGSSFPSLILLTIGIAQTNWPAIRRTCVRSWTACTTRSGWRRT